MPWYRCVCCAENLPIPIEGDEGLSGFYTTRFVEAEDPESAAREAFAMLAQHEALKGLAGSSELLMECVVVEDVDLVESQDVPSVQPGLAWFPMGS